MDRPSTAHVYERAGFGRPVVRGARPAVVVVDFTYGFTDPQYPTAVDMTAPVLATARLLDAARAAGAPVVFTTISYDAAQVAALAWLRKAPGMAALQVGSRLVEIDQRLSPRPDEHLLTKTGASAFFGTALAGHLASVGADTVIVTGATTSGCVRATAVDAVQHGYPVLVPNVCVGDRARAPHDASLFDINEKYGDVVGLDDVLAYLEALRPDPPEPEQLSTTTSQAEARA
ncbi:isochorismatase family protein [Pseudonocardia sp. MH-G8]|uniref:isochorismatase family protein n=1 Tax=Pseudonocardia sp. MH-G8 TaxID=1854588 RepID=UPI001E637BFE|nr:isochorismatase family protein [Pseudonocardia sp. MH-G8]